MSFISFVVSKFFRVCVGWLGTWCFGSMLHKLLSRAFYFPSILRMSLMEGPKRRWYDRVDSTVILGALPFKSQTKEVSAKRRRFVGQALYVGVSCNLPHPLYIFNVAHY